MTHLRVLNLGAGVQSTSIYLMMIDGLLPKADMAIFADCGDEPKAVYEHLAFLQTLPGTPIEIVSAGNLGDNLSSGVNSTGQRFVSIPSFMSNEDDGNNTGIGRRQCTSEYKIHPIESRIRVLAGGEKGKRLPKDVTVTQIFGLSFDKPKRVARVRGLYEGRKNWLAEFPLFDEFMTRADCESYLEQRLPGRKVPRSACVFCPYRSDEEWLYLKTTDPEGFARAVQVDYAIRNPASASTRGLNAKQYLHRSCQPLDLVQLNPKPPSKQTLMNWSNFDCEGMCGN